MSEEKDPSGISASTPGAKLDAGKLRAGLVVEGFQNALRQVAEVGTFGAAKYSDNGWRSVPDGRKRYSDALFRHLLADGVDEQSGLPHLAHAAWNILALLELEATAIKPAYPPTATADADAESHWIDPKDGKRYEAVKNDACHGCAMNEEHGKCTKTLMRGRPACGAQVRSDGQDVSWQEVPV